jgi:hypothetical protein
MSTSAAAEMSWPVTVKPNGLVVRLGDLVVGVRECKAGQGRRGGAHQHAPLEGLDHGPFRPGRPQPEGPAQARGRIY